VKHLPRHLAPILLRGARAVPALVVTGPRQSGKTTLVKALFADRPYVTLEDADERERAVGDPRTFLARHRDGAVFDEVQRAPELLSYLQSEVDRDPRPGRFVLTGSENLLLSERISQSLAGRCLIYRLLPFSVAESVGRAPSDPTRLHEPDYAPPTGPKVPPLDECLFRGGYPRAHEADIDLRGWLLTYQETYLERDVRQIQRVGDLDLFRRFMALCAGRSAQILNIASLANDAGVSAGTARSWLSILEATFVLTTLPSHHENFNKRVVRAPKLHFLDTGLLCSLLGVRSAADLGNHPLRGAIFETFAYSEFAKAFWNSGERPPLYYWRDKTGREVDLLVDLGIRRIPWECKAGATIRDDAFDGLRAWSRLAGVDPPCGGLACGAAASAPWREFVARGYGEIS
jgi:predicted AAA+ superfamily ATPase